MRSHKFHSTTENLNALWRIVHKTKDGTTHVRVPVEDLKPILLDHSKLWGLVKEDLG